MKEYLFISLDRHNLLPGLIAGSILTLVLLMSLVLSRAAFAGQPPLSYQVPVKNLSEKELLKRLTTDVPDFVDAKKDSGDSWRVVQMRVTAYCPCSKCCGEYSDGITACNHRIQDGDRFVAADKMYSFGTEMIIPGYNGSQPVEVKDRGGLIQDGRLDVFFNTHQEALEWGVQYLDVLVKIR